jgi:hypothetical protein
MKTNGWDALTTGLLDEVQGGGAQDAVQDGRRREEQRGMTKAQRKEHQRQKSRVRIYAEATRCPWLKDEVEALAEEVGVPVGNMAAWLVARGVRAFREGERPTTVICDLPMYERLIDVGEGDAGL